MECMCAQTRTRSTLSSERVGGGGGGGVMESEPMLIPREKSPLPENFPQRRMEPTTLQRARQRAKHTTNELFRPLYRFVNGVPHPGQSAAVHCLQALDMSWEIICFTFLHLGLLRSGLSGFRLVCLSVSHSLPPPPPPSPSHSLFRQEIHAKGQNIY